MDNKFDFTRQTSDKKQRILDEYISSPIGVDDYVSFDSKLISSKYVTSKREYRTVLKIDGDMVGVNKNYDWSDKINIVFIPMSACKKEVMFVGANPFCKKDWWRKSQILNFTLESIIYKISDEYGRDAKCQLNDGTVVNIPNVNWNPYVTTKSGERQFYQRDFCWTLKDKQNLIDSIYNHIECGKVIIRKHSYEDIAANWSYGDKTMCWMDIVDGKQRLSTLLDFINNKFTDSQGNYFADLSFKSQHEFLDVQLITYCEMNDECTDEDVITTFLMVNFSGVPQSTEHIDYVKSILDKII